MKARWKTTLEAAKDEVILAVDLYNQSNQPRRLEGFFVHMHMGWLYLFEARYQRDGLDYHYRLSNGRFERVNGEPKTWDLSKFVHTELADGNPVRINLDLTIALRNKIEHRYEEATTVATTGYAQALLLNFEEMLTLLFGQDNSLGSHLRFPIFIGTFTPEGISRLANTQQSLPTRTKKFLANFEATLSHETLEDHRYEFRIQLIPKIGPKSEADLALTFVRQDELTPEERLALEQLNRSGTVIVRDRIQPVLGADMMKPTESARQVETRIPFLFGIQHFVRAWKKFEVRPPKGSSHPERTNSDFCIYDRPHGDYLYTARFVERIVNSAETPDGFKELTSLEPILKTESDSN